MIPIAHPLADEATAQAVLRETTASHAAGTLVSGIRACQKDILAASPDTVVVFSATTSPMDLITHLPILCEESSIPYIFVPDAVWMKGFTCVALRTGSNSDDIRQILSQASRGVPQK